MSTPAQRLIFRFPRYRFTADGQIFSGFKCAYLKPSIGSRGYKIVTLIDDDGNKRGALVHRLICEAFHGSCPTGFTANHKNGDKADNRAENLEWVSQSENVRHAYRLGLRVIDADHRARCAALGRAKRRISPEAVASVRAGFTGRRGDVMRLSRAHGIGHKEITKILKGQYS